MDRQKLIHQLFVGKVTEIIGYEKTMALLRESTEAFDLEPKDECDHDYTMIGHQCNGHYECTKCKQKKSLN